MAAVQSLFHEMVLVCMYMVWIAPTTAAPPSGKLLAMVQYYGALFQIDLDGKVTTLYNRSFVEDFFTDCQYALDYENKLAYLPAVHYVLGVDINSGKTVIKKPAPKPVLFESFNYNAKNKSINGVCTGNDQWNWCELTKNGTVVFKYQLPYTSELGPIDCDYNADFGENLFWYDPGSGFILAIDTTNGNLTFKSGPATTFCITYDSVAKRIYAVSRLGLNGPYSLTEIHLDPKPATHIKELPKNLMLASIGSCAIDPQSHTVFILMRPATLIQTMPTALIIVNLDSAKITGVNLPSFGPAFETTKFILNTKFIGD